MYSYRPKALSPSLLLAVAMGISVAFAESSTTAANTDNTSAVASAAAAVTTASTSASTAAATAAQTTAATAAGSLPGLTDTAAGHSSSAASTSSHQTTATSLPQLVTLTGLPTLPGGFSYPAPTVPPTANAPYMQLSNLPEDTVFIVVGAFLAFVALTMIAWRVLVAWTVNRSVKRSAAAGYAPVSESKNSRNKSSRPLSMGMSAYPYNNGSLGSTMSLDKLGPGQRAASNLSKAHPPASNASLFFSPTAGAGMHNSGSARNSAYLPSGYYATGTAAAPGQTTIGGPGDRLSKLRPHSTQYVSTTSLGISPPGSPELRPSTAGVPKNDSRSSVNLSIGPGQGQRTPSTYLDDLIGSGVGSTSQAPQYGGEYNQPPAPPQQHQHQREHSRGVSRDERRATSSHRTNRAQQPRY